MPSHTSHTSHAPVLRGTARTPIDATPDGQRGGQTRSPRGALEAAHPPQRVQDPERVLRAYTLWHEAEGHSRKTEHVYAHTLHPFFRYLATEHSVTDLADLELEHLRAWLVWLRNTLSPHGKPRASKTIESYCRQVKAFVRWCVSEGILEHDPTIRLKLPKAEKKHLRVFTDEEVKLLHEACLPPRNGLRADVQRMLAARNRAILWVLLDTGMRTAELRGMRFMDFDRKRGTIYIMGKGAKERKLLLGQRGYHYLCAYLDHWRGEPTSSEERLILSDAGTPLSEQTVTKTFARLKRRSGITDKRVSAHTCRHWYAIRFLLKGGKLFALQRHLGHETLEMVKIYAHITDQDAEEEKRKYSPADDVALEPQRVTRRGFRNG
jgi:site-specific recombinase XerD